MADDSQSDLLQQIEALERKNKLLEDGLHQAERLRQMFDRTAKELKATKLLLVHHSAELAESEERFRKSFRYAAIGMGLVGLDGRWLKANHALCQIVGYTEPELLEKTFQDITHPDDLQSDLDLVAQLLAGKIEHYQMEKRYFHKDGHLVWIRLSVSLILDAHGNPIHFVSQIEDITKDRQLEEGLRASEQKFMQFFMGVPVALGVVNQDGIITYFNHRFTQIFGYTTDDVPTIQDWWQRAYPDEVYRQRVMESWGIAAAKAAKEGTDIELAGYKVTSKSGAELITEIGGFTFGGNLLATFVDITERKRAEEALNNMAVKFKTVFESSSDAIFLNNEKGFIDCNEAAVRMFGGSSHDEIIGKHPGQLSPPTQPGGRDSMSLSKELIAAAFKDGSNRFEWMHCRLDGSEFPAEVLLTAMKLDGKAVLQATARDITERKLAEEKIRKLNEELETKVQERTQQLRGAQEELLRKEKLAVLGQVAGSVGHELRNPLGVMNNAVYYLQTVLADADSGVKEYLNIIKDEIAGSERIVSDLLDAVRTQPPRSEAVGVAKLVGQTLGKLTLPPAVSVKLDFSKTLPALRIDAMQIHQVLRNLISNAIEAMPEGGTLEISALENTKNGTVSIKVQDSGSGIAPDVLPKLFQPLFTTKARGIGLGLVVVKNLTEANSGTVQVESVAGKGSVFTVTLPAADETGGVI
jgi:PAS domain S-box-containing protein